jgi:hypothetical protein
MYNTQSCVDLKWIHEGTQTDYRKGGTKRTRGKLRRNRETRDTGCRRDAILERRQRGDQTDNALSPRHKVVVAEVASKVQAGQRG